MKKFRFHWGWAIGSFYALFVIAILIIVVRSFSVDNTLVVDDYYSYDIAYQDHADKRANAKMLEKDVEKELDYEQRLYLLRFPDIFSKYTGDIQFYKPDNKALDFTVKVNPDDSGEQKIDISPLVKGYWKIHMNWEGDGKEFYWENSFYLQ